MLKEAHNRHFYLTLILAFLMPIYQKWVPLVIVLLTLNWLSQGKKAFQFYDWRKNVSMWLLIAFYTWHAVAMLWSNNMDFGFFDLQIKLSFVLLPVIYLSFGRFSVSRFEAVLSAYILGCLGAIFLGLINSVYAYYTGENPFLDFYNLNIAPVLHISYFAMYLNLGLVMVLYKIIKNEENFYTLKNAGLIFSSFVFALATFLSTSRNGFLALLFLLLIIFTYAIIRYRKWLLGITMVLMLWIVASSLFKDIGSGKFGLHGFDQVGTVMKAETLSKDEGESTAVRLLVWKSAVEVIRENFILGVGTGDVKDELMHTYEKNGYSSPLKKQYNAHNQYLQTFAALGVIGFLIFLGCIAVPAFLSFMRYNYLYLMFSLNFGVSCLTESILEVQAGVVFFAFFTALFSPLMNASVNRRFRFLSARSN